MNVKNSVLELIGNTPLLRLNKITEGIEANVLVKLEFFNPLSSVKDRTGLALIEDAEVRGFIQPGSVIVESTSGNTGIALAYICAIKGYKLVLTMPETMSKERLKLLKIFGADVILTEAHKGMSGSMEKAEEILKSTPGAITLHQFDNPANPEIHRKTTGEEIWKDTEGNVDIFIAAVGTGGTFSGVSSLLKEKNPAVRCIAVEPSDSPVISGGKPGAHSIQGIGAGFVPGNLNRSLIDEIIQVDNEDAIETVRILARREGVLSGISGGANMWASIQTAKKPENAGKTIVTIIPDFGERYLSLDFFSRKIATTGDVR